ncbi:MAG: N-acetylglucosamine kinase [Devosia sp.]
MTGTVHLGIDVGGTASRWVACDAQGTILARGAANGATGHLFNPVEKTRMIQAITAIAADLGGHGLAAGFVTIGSTGYGAAVFEPMMQLLVDSFGIARDCIIIADDMTLTYAGIFAPGQGHLVSAGTGSIGLHIGADGSFVRVGGRGILIDDAGSGSWIALRALDQLYRCLDRRGSFSAMDVLAREVFSLIGTDDWHGVRAFIYGSDRGVIGTLAVAVGKAAEQGDTAALAILSDAGAELAQLALALTARVGTRPIGLIGGVLTLHPSIGERIHTELAGHEVRLEASDAALAAARLTLDSQGAWRQVLAAKSALG